MFDFIFLLKPLSSYPDITLKAIIKNGKFINLSIKYGKNNAYYNINLRDSYLLLSSSLSKICDAFKVAKEKDKIKIKICFLIDL